MDVRKDMNASHTNTVCKSTAKPDWTFQEEWFPVEELYDFVARFAHDNGLKQTSAALPFMKAAHAGQVRKGS